MPASCPSLASLHLDPVLLASIHSIHSSIPHSLTAAFCPCSLIYSPLFLMHLSFSTQPRIYWNVLAIAFRFFDSPKTSARTDHWRAKKKLHNPPAGRINQPILPLTASSLLYTGLVPGSSRLNININMYICKDMHRIINVFDSLKLSTPLQFNCTQSLAGCPCPSRLLSRPSDRDHQNNSELFCCFAMQNQMIIPSHCIIFVCKFLHFLAPNNNSGNCFPKTAINKWRGGKQVNRKAKATSTWRALSRDVGKGTATMRPAKD